MDASQARARFPVFARGDAPVFLDNPAGTQIAGRAIERMVAAMVERNANLGGRFRTSIEAAALVGEAHAAMASFLGAAGPDEIVFGQNMTTLTFAMSRAIGRTLKAGDAIVLTRMDHDANVAPWLMLAADLGLDVRWIDFDPDGFEFDLSRLGEVITPGVKLVAAGYASNLTGTIHDVAAIARAARAVGALTYIDAVQFAPHGLIDVQALGCDLLVCSAYKFYGPHQGILWGRRDLLQSLDAYKVRPAPSAPPGKFESGTTSREALAGVLGAVEYFAGLGDAPRPDHRPDRQPVAGAPRADRVVRRRRRRSGRDRRGDGGQGHLAVERPQLRHRADRAARPRRARRRGAGRPRALQRR